jgi:hypothetical protein
VQHQDYSELTTKYVVCRNPFTIGRKENFTDFVKRGLFRFVWDVIIVGMREASRSGFIHNFILKFGIGHSPGISTVEYHSIDALRGPGVPTSNFIICMKVFALVATIIFSLYQIK